MEILFMREVKTEWWPKSMRGHLKGGRNKVRINGSIEDNTSIYISRNW